jgi:hypothetical protein
MVNWKPIVERLAQLTDSGQATALSVLEIVPECGVDDFPSRRFLEEKLKEKKERGNQ